jgi:effector-binding domain-containing protein
VRVVDQGVVGEGGHDGVHHGSLADADLSYAKLGSYATTHEISIDGPLREYYLRGAGDTPDEAEWRTEIGWPIFRADASRA